MRVTLTPKDLDDFETEVADAFRAKKIPFPVHLRSGGAESLIRVFEERVGPDDWCLGTWRFHWHCLLKGVPRERVMADILAGRSITLNYPDFRCLSSAIVAGIAPIAVGLALGIKRRREDRRVFAFVGDMAWRTGAVREAVAYAAGHELPLCWVIEDNSLSVCTPTEEVWGTAGGVPSFVWYRYASEYPHCGLDEWISF
jgi:TPP-dependent pyruvate/acetoin dehydrogenase alpha subunit